jgi:hypothetical protein
VMISGRPPTRAVDFPTWSTRLLRAGRNSFAAAMAGKWVVSKEYFNQTKSNLKSYLVGSVYADEQDDVFDVAMRGVRADSDKSPGDSQYRNPGCQEQKSHGQWRQDVFYLHVCCYVALGWSWEHAVGLCSGSGRIVAKPGCPLMGLIRGRAGATAQRRSSWLQSQHGSASDWGSGVPISTRGTQKQKNSRLVERICREAGCGGGDGAGTGTSFPT